MALITDYCHACHQRRPCACDEVKPLSPLPTPEEQPSLDRRLAEAVSMISPPENVVSLSAERFRRDTNPRNHSPRAALERAMEFFDELPSNREISHAIVIFAIEGEGGFVSTRFIQAGAYNYHGQMGVVAEAQQLMREAE